jgi:hypothetical protein
VEAADTSRAEIPVHAVRKQRRVGCRGHFWATVSHIALLEHEQRAPVQPNLDRLSCAFARLFSIGSALTFEVRGLREEASYFTSFYLYALTRGIPQTMRTRAWPRITRYDDRWRWIVTSIVPRFRRFDADMRLLDVSLRRIFDDASNYASNPCVLPRPPQTEEPAPSGEQRRCAASTR